MHLHLPRPILPILLFIALALVPCAAQQIRPSREILAQGYGFLDDVELTPQGQILVSHPASATVGYLAPGGASILPLYTGTVHGMGLEPGGQALWVGEWMSGDLHRIDLSTGLVTQTLSGLFSHPHEIVFTSPTSFIVGDLDVPDFHFGTSSLHRVTLGGSAPVVTLLAGGLLGGVDAIEDANGRVYCASLSGTTVDEILPGGSRVPLAQNVLQPTDLVLDPEGNGIYISTILIGEILHLRTDVPTLTVVDALLAGSIGPGCEDLAWDGDALLVSMSDGTLRRAIVRGGIAQRGLPIGGFSLDLRLAPGIPTAVNYLVGASLGLAPAPLALPTPSGSQNFFLDLGDPAFLLSQDPMSTLFLGMAGTIPANGIGTATTHVPNVPGLVVDLYYQAVYLQGSLIHGASDALRVRLWSL